MHSVSNSTSSGCIDKQTLPGKYFYKKNEEKKNYQLIRDYILSERLDDLEEALNYIPESQIKRIEKKFWFRLTVFSAEKKSYTILSFLLQKGYIPDIRDLNNMAENKNVHVRAFQIISKNCAIPYSSLARAAIIRTDNFKVQLDKFQYFAKNAKNPPSDPNYLFKAIDERSKLFVRHLLNAKANVNSNNDKGDSPLHVAVSNNYYPTPIQRKNQRIIIELLINHNADVNAKNQNGHTALDVVLRDGSPPSRQKKIAILRENGAKAHKSSWMRYYTRLISGEIGW